MLRKVTIGMALVAVLWVSQSSGQNTVFTYQGRLTDGGQPANGNYDLRFTLTDSLTLGNVIAGPVTNISTLVSSGMFTAALSFPSSAFDGSARWMEIGARTNGSTNAYTTLSPRQAITASPYASYSARAGVAVALLGGGAGLTNLNGTNIQSGTINSNGLDAATKALLGGSQTNIAIGGVTNAGFLASSNDIPAAKLFGTNILTGTNRFTKTATFSDMNFAQIDSNTTNSGGTWFGWASISNGAISLPAFNQSPGGTASGSGGGVRFYLPNGNQAASVSVWGNHNGTNGPELLIDSTKSIHIRPTGDGGSLGSITMGQTGGSDLMLIQYSGVEQLGAPGNTDGITTFPFAHSQALYWACIGTNGASGSTYAALPGIIGVANTNNTYPDSPNQNFADGELWFYTHVPEPTSVTPHTYAAIGKVMGKMRTNGWDFRGGMRQTRMAVTSSNTCPLDFDYQCVDITCGSPSVSFYSTNATGISTNYEGRTFIIRSGGLSRTLTWPNWSVLGATNGTTLPGSLSPGQMIRLKLESLGVGESNRIATYTIGQDNSF